MRQDILLDETGDVSLEDGFILTDGNVTGVERVMEQDKRAVITSLTGDYINNIDIGVNIMDYINDNRTDLLCREISKQCNLVGMTVKTISFDGTELKIDSIYDTN